MKKIHPAAEAFPLLEGEELDELVADIQANGLINPIMLDKEGRIIDGRNREAACKKAGVKPKYETYDGDPIAYIIATNVHRRHLSKSQQAMAVAILHPKKAKPGPKKDRKPSLPTDFSKTLLMQARTVLREFGRDSSIVQQVIHGASLKDAYQAALDKRAQEEALKAKINELKLHMEKFGPEKSVEISDIDLSVTYEDGVESLSPVLFPKIAEQEKYISTLVHLKLELERLSNQSLVENGWNSKSYLASICSGCNEIIEAVLKIRDSHKDALERFQSKPKIREVK